jgi:hypothetical protein
LIWREFRFGQVEHPEWDEARRNGIEGCVPVSQAFFGGVLTAGR